MKLSTFATFLSLSVALATVLDTRQQCNEDDCFRAVFGSGGFGQIIRAGEDCDDFLTTSVIWYPMFVAQSRCLSNTLTVYSSTTITSFTLTTSTLTIPCPSDVLPVPTDEPITSDEEKLWIRQALPTGTNWSTTTVFGPVPTYATQACVSQEYKSVCGCASITEDTVTYLGTVSFMPVYDEHWLIECRRL